jgi:hypothetical protein
MTIFYLKNTHYLTIDTRIQLLKQRIIHSDEILPLMSFDFFCHESVKMLFVKKHLPNRFTILIRQLTFFKLTYVADGIVGKQRFS